MKYGLNSSKSNNYAFWDPQSRLHLTIDNPVGYADRVTVAIKRGLVSKSIFAIIEKDGETIHTFDVEEEINNTPVEEKVEEKKEVIPEPVIQEQNVEESKEVEAVAEAEPAVEVPEEEPKKTSKRGRKTTK